jgi:predicted DNA-binding antitoxin AbrB/MazE fold protein
LNQVQRGRSGATLLTPFLSLRERHKPMTTTVQAIFENGVFRPVEPVALPERTSVELEVRTAGQPQPPLPMPDGLAKIYSILGERYDSGCVDTAARHNEHQP